MYGPTDHFPLVTQDGSNYTLPYAFYGDAFFNISKQDWVARWLAVPRDFIVQTSSDRALNLEACIGKVSNYDWWGWPGHTILMNNFKVIPQPSPTYTGLLRPALPLSYVDVELGLSFLDPPRPCALIVLTTTGVTNGSGVVTGLG